MKQYLTVFLISLLATHTMAVSLRDRAQEVKAQYTARMQAQKALEKERRQNRLNSSPDEDKRFTVDRKALIKMFQVETPTDQGLNYFQKFRHELNRLSQEEHTLAKTRGAFKNSLIKLPIDTMGFFIATGAINFMSLWNQSGGNPLVFQEQVLNLKDPIANFSFYAFMVANGFYTNFRSDRLSTSLSAENKALALRRISYQALAAGSFASSVSADIGSSIKQCANSWLTLDSKRQQITFKKTQNIKTTADEDLLEKSDQLCAEANKIWTVRKSTERYLPQIFSLLLVQAATEFTQQGVNSGIAMSTAGLYNLLKKTGGQNVFKLAFVNVLLSASPSNWAIKSFAFVGKITQFTLFVGVDHALNSTFTRGFNNMFKPILFHTFDQYGLNMNFEVGGKYQWDVDKITSLRPLFDPTARPDKNTAEGVFSFAKFQTSFPNEIQNFTEQLQAWRDHLNSDAEYDLNAWQETTNRILNQLQVSEEFYGTYLRNLFNTAHINHRVKLPNTDPAHLPTEALRNASMFPYRALPLFGVKYIPWAGSEVKEENAYLAYPSETEREQSLFLIKIADWLVKNKTNIYKNYRLNSSDEKIISELIEDLKTGHILTQANALKKFMHEYNKSIYNNNVEFRNFGKFLTEYIGHPKPQLHAGSGFSAAFQMENKGQFEAAAFDTVDSKLNVNLTDPGQYLMHAMLCGGKKGVIKEHDINFIFSQYTMWEPDFLPPAIVKNTAKEFCVQNGGGVSSENFYTAPLTDSAEYKVYNNVNSYISQNILPEVLGDYRDKAKIADFPKWWKTQVMNDVPEMLRKWDQRYTHIVNKAMGNMFDEKYLSTKIVDSATQFNFFNNNLLGSSLADSYSFEKEFYLQTIHIVRSKMKFNLPAKGSTNILSEAKKIAMGKSSSILKKLTAPEYVDVTKAFDSLMTELAKPVTYLNHADQLKSDAVLKEEAKKQKNMPEQLDYKKYLTLQSNFETAVSNLEVAVGLKTISKNQASANLFDLPEDSESSETAINAEVKPKQVTYDIVPIQNHTLEQSVVMAAAAGLRNIESNISKYIRMKILMRRGLSFTNEELSKFKSEEISRACSKSARGC